MSRRPGIAVGSAAAGAGLVGAAVLGPLALSLTGGAGRPLPALLLLETAYLLLAFACLGAGPARGATALRAMGVAAAPALVAAIACLAGAPAPGRVWAAQLPAVGAAILGWGVGRAARAAAGAGSRGAALALAGVAVFATSLLFVSHLSPGLAASPRAGALLLALDPFVAVSAAAGLDPVRSQALYDALTLSGQRFAYPGPGVSLLVLAVTGLALGHLRPTLGRSFRRARARRARPALSSSREVSA